jgi:hypothetical protein
LHHEQQEASEQWQPSGHLDGEWSGADGADGAEAPADLTRLAKPDGALNTLERVYWERREGGDSGGEQGQAEGKSTQEVWAF